MTLLSPTAYARAIGVSPSTISRAISKGKLPVVTDADGKTLVDRQAADSARRRDSNIRSGHGGAPDRAIRKRSIWKAQSTDGYDPAVKACLAVMVSEWPQLLRDAMAILGASELDCARAVVALEDMVGTLACVVHQDFNKQRVNDFRQPLPDRPVLDWSADVKTFIERVGYDGHGSAWTGDEGLSGGAEWSERSMSACWSAKP